jgi:hypothetical protein
MVMCSLISSHCTCRAVQGLTRRSQRGIVLPPKGLRSDREREPKNSTERNYVKHAVHDYVRLLLTKTPENNLCNRKKSFGEIHIGECKGSYVRAHIYLVVYRKWSSFRCKSNPQGLILSLRFIFDASTSWLKNNRLFSFMDRS